MGEAWHLKHEDSQLAEIVELPAPNPIMDALLADQDAQPVEAALTAVDRIAALEAEVVVLKAKVGL